MLPAAAMLAWMPAGGKERLAWGHRVSRWRWPVGEVGMGLQPASSACSHGKQGGNGKEHKKRRGKNDRFYFTKIIVKIIFCLYSRIFFFF